MADIVLSGSTSGSVTLSAQAVSGSTTLTLPTTSGTVLTSASDITTQVKSATNATGSAPIYTCRAWVNFNGTGTPAIRASGNVSSITDNGTGDYTVNFTTAMSDADYAGAVTCGNPGGTSIDRDEFKAFASGSLRVEFTMTGVATVDPLYVCVAIFR